MIPKGVFTGSYRRYDFGILQRVCGQREAHPVACGVFWISHNRTHTKKKDSHQPTKKKKKNTIKKKNDNINIL